MGYTVKEWVDQFCSTMEDGPSLRIMRGRAIAGAALECSLLEDIRGILPRDDPWFSQIIQQRDIYLDCVESIEARLDELGYTYGNERNYGLSSESLRLVNKARKARTEP